jgi:hypothetical protein
MNNWIFDQPENAAALTTVNVLEKNYPILVVIHYSDDHSWAFLCGTTDKTEDGRVISMIEAVRIDPTLSTIFSQPHGYATRRNSVDSE